jgi:hypothetical protein
MPIRRKALANARGRFETALRFREPGTWHRAKPGRADPAGRLTMKAGNVFRLSKAALIATALLSSSSVAFAAPSLASPEMKVALAKAQEGPTELRRFVQRTRAIYQLDYAEVMGIHEQRQAVAATQAPALAKADPR